MMAYVRVRVSGTHLMRDSVCRRKLTTSTRVTAAFASRTAVKKKKINKFVLIFAHMPTNTHITYQGTESTLMSNGDFLEAHLVQVY